MKYLSLLLTAFLLAALPTSSLAQSITADNTVIEVVDAGDAPRQQLRFVAPVGHQQTVNVAMDMSMEMAGMPGMTLPTMNMLMTIEVTETLPNGDIRYTYHMDDTSVNSDDPAAAEMIVPMEASLQMLEGLSGNALMNARGLGLETQVNLPDSFGPEAQQALQGMDQAMEQMGLPLPEEAIGVGGKWKLTTEIQQNGLVVNQEATYTLLERDGNELTISATYVQTAPQQEVEAGVELVSLDSSGEGELKISLDEVSPSFSDFSMQVAMEMAAGGMESMNMNSTVKVLLTEQ